MGQKCLEKNQKTTKLLRNYADFDINSISGNKKFWQIVKPLFSNKGKTTFKLFENDVMTDDEIEIAKIFNDYFVIIVKRLVLFCKSTISTENSLNEVEITIAKHGSHPSIIAITEKMEKLGNPSFSFDFTSHEGIVKEVNSLKIRKVSQKTDNPKENIFKENIDVVSLS